MTDGALLAALLDRSELTPRERTAFERMLVTTMAYYGSLTFAQRQWAQAVAATLGIAGVGHPGSAPDVKHVDTTPPKRGAEAQRKVYKVAADFREWRKRKRTGR